MTIQDLQDAITLMLTVRSSLLSQGSRVVWRKVDRAIEYLELQMQDALAE